MIKVKDLIEELKAEYPGYRIRATMRRKCLPHYGYGRLARYITDADAQRIRTDIGAVMYLIRLEEAFGEPGVQA